MDRQSWDDSSIHAYVDGELDAETSARLEAQSRSDTELAARIARQRELRTLLGAEFDAVLDEPVPQRLRDALDAPARGEIVTPIGAARKAVARAPRVSWSLREWGAIAAALVLGVLLGPIAFRGSNDVPIRADQGGLVAAGYLDSALSTQVAGRAAQGTGARIVVSFRAASGEYCRTFQLRVGDGLACRRDGRWFVPLFEAKTEPRSDDGDFRQASSGLTPAMLSEMNTLGASEPLTADEEQQRLRAGWDAKSP
jgi:hypothetical protein